MVEIPITMTAAEANKLLQKHPAALAMADTIAVDLVEKRLTPLEAQAVLTAAWAGVMKIGRLSLLKWDSHRPDRKRDQT